eukprot:1155204-Pelagomonas_calceolata.AAC.6
MAHVCMEKLFERVVETHSGTKPVELKSFNATFSKNAPRWCSGFHPKKLLVEFKFERESAADKERSGLFHLASNSSKRSLFQAPG